MPPNPYWTMRLALWNPDDPDTKIQVVRSWSPLALDCYDSCQNCAACEVPTAFFDSLHKGCQMPYAVMSLLRKGVRPKDRILQGGKPVSRSDLL